MSKQTKQFFQEQNTGDSRILLKIFGTKVQGSYQNPAGFTGKTTVGYPLSQFFKFLDPLQTIQGPPVYLLLGKQKPKSYASAETCL